MIPDRRKFPGGTFQGLIDSIHDKGMKVGIYSDSGRYTCAGRPGSRGSEKKDAETFARWKIDCRPAVNPITCSDDTRS